MSTQGLPFELGHLVTEIPGRGGIIAPGPAPCHRCDTPATTQWPRHATEAETAQHWDAVEQNIRANGTPDYVADRSDTVVKAVHGCDEHAVDAPHLTHDADCGGHGACACAPAEPEPATQNLGGYAAPVTFDPDGTPHWPANPTS